MRNVASFQMVVTVSRPKPIELYPMFDNLIHLSYSLYLPYFRLWFFRGGLRLLKRSLIWPETVKIGALKWIPLVLPKLPILDFRVWFEQNPPVFTEALQIKATVCQWSRATKRILEGWKSNTLGCLGKTGKAIFVKYTLIARFYPSQKLSTEQVINIIIEVN